MFDFKTIAEDFENHISLSIPTYKFLHETILELSDYFITENSNIVDIGASTGKLLSEIYDRNRSCNAVAYEIERKFHTMYPEHFVVKGDATCYYEHTVSFCMSVFTMQFLNYESRIKLMRDIFNSLNVGGGFVIAEKVYNGNIYDHIFQDILLDSKRAKFSEKEILDKNKNLRGSLRSYSCDELTRCLAISGFSDIQMFYRDKNFVGYVCRKGVI